MHLVHGDGNNQDDKDEIPPSGDRDTLLDLQAPHLDQENPLFLETVVDDRDAADYQGEFAKKNILPEIGPGLRSSTIKLRTTLPEFGITYSALTAGVIAEITALPDGNFRLRRSMRLDGRKHGDELVITPKNAFFRAVKDIFERVQAEKSITVMKPMPSLNFTAADVEMGKRLSIKREKSATGYVFLVQIMNKQIENGPSKIIIPGEKAYSELRKLFPPEPKLRSTPGTIVGETRNAVASAHAGDSTPQVPSTIAA